jgi:hypothetical protein
MDFSAAYLTDVKMEAYFRVTHFISELHLHLKAGAE